MKISIQDANITIEALDAFYDDVKNNPFIEDETKRTEKLRAIDEATNVIKLLTE